MRMEFTEKKRLADFEVLEQAEARVWRGKGTAGEKKSQVCGSKSSV